MVWPHQLIWNRLKARVTGCREVLAGDFDYSKDYYFGLDLLMIPAGVRLDTDRALVRRVWNIYRVGILLPAAIFTHNCVSAILNRKSLDIVLSILQATIEASTVLALIFTLCCKYDSLMAVRAYLNARQFGSDRKSTFAHRAKTFYRIRRNVIILGLCQLCAVCSLFFIDLSTNFLFKLPFNLRDRHPLLQNTCELVEIVVSYGAASMAVVIFITIYATLTGMRTELEIIAEQFGFILEKADTRTTEKIESEPCEPGNSKQLELMTKYYVLKFAHEEFRECIILHQEFMAALKKVKSFLNAAFLIFYYAATLCIACGAVYLLKDRKLTISALLIAYCAFVALIPCYLFTKLVTELTEANESIAEQVYNMDWPSKLQFDPLLASEYRSMRLTMLIVMAQSQQPLRLNCFGFFEFTQDKFTDLADGTYSLISFFKDFI